MPVYSISEFAELVGKPPKSIHTYISRDHLVKNEHKQIDTSVEINRIYLEQYGVDQPEQINGNKSKVKKVNGVKKQISKKEEPEKISIRTQLEIEQKRLSIDRTKRENNIKEIELKRLRGELINLEKTIAVVSSYSDNLKRDLLQNIQTHIQDICARHNIDKGKTGEYKSKVSKIINQSSKLSIEILIKQFGNET